MRNVFLILAILGLLFIIVPLSMGAKVPWLIVLGLVFSPFLLAALMALFLSLTGFIIVFIALSKAFLEDE